MSGARVHASPAVTGFDSLTGSAPDWFTLTATRGICVSDLSATFTTTGDGTTPCYTVTFIFDAGTQVSCIISR